MKFVKFYTSRYKNSEAKVIEVNTLDDLCDIVKKECLPVIIVKNIRAMWTFPHIDYKETNGWTIEVYDDYRE